MSDAPERIWAFEPDIFDNVSVWQDAPSPAGDTIEYVRADTITALEEENKRLREAFTWFLRHTSGKEMRKMGIVLNDSSDLEEAIQAIETRAALEGE